MLFISFYFHSKFRLIRTFDFCSIFFPWKILIQSNKIQIKSNRIKSKINFNNNNRKVEIRTADLLFNRLRSMESISKYFVHVFSVVVVIIIISFASPSFLRLHCSHSHTHLLSVLNLSILRLYCWCWLFCINDEKQKHKHLACSVQYREL